MSVQTRPHPVQRNWVARHPLTAFTGLALTAAYLVEAVMVLVDRSVIPGRALVSRLGFGMEETASVALVVVLATTTLVVTGLSDGRAGITTLLRRTDPVASRLALVGGGGRVTAPADRRAVGHPR